MTPRITTKIKKLSEGELMADRLLKSRKKPEKRDSIVKTRIPHDYGGPIDYFEEDGYWWVQLYLPEGTWEDHSGMSKGNTIGAWFSENSARKWAKQFFGRE